MVTPFTRWIRSVYGHYVTMDGNYPVENPYQCWDLWESFHRNLVNNNYISTQFSPYPGFAIAIWDGYGRNGAEEFYDRKPANATPKRGWVAIWQYGQSATPFSHIAIVNRVNRDGSIRFYTQNPGPVHLETITTAGLAGYLVPKNWTMIVPKYHTVITIHTVIKRSTKRSIKRKYKTTWHKIAKWNGFKWTAPIKVGQRLRIKKRVKNG